MNTPGSLFLIGPMGAGKSTIGRQLSRQLGMPFHDSDREIERRTGVDIGLIFDLEGESGFRKREHAVIEELTAIPDIILATGGGAVLDPVNRENLRAGGRVIYLHTTVRQQLARTSKDSSRPLLQTDDPRARLEELMTEREPLYRDIADLIIDTDGKHVRDVVKQILRQI